MNEAEISTLEAAERVACNADADVLGVYVQRMLGTGHETVQALRAAWYAARAARRDAQRALLLAKLSSQDYDYMHDLGRQRLAELDAEAEKDGETALEAV